MMISDQEKEHLIKTAMEASKWVYAPYSNYPVGAALLTSSGRIYDGVNIENAVFPLSICAERVAAFKAVSEGELEFNAIAVVTRDGGSPCGSCRQVLSEFGPKMLVIITDEKGEIILETTVAELLPNAFGPNNLHAGD